MELNITKETFETMVPTFRQPTGEVFAKMTAFIGAEVDRWTEMIKADITPMADMDRQLVRAVCLRAAFEAVPHLDLVLTPTGFGIVSNQTTAPASRERVDALIRQLYRHSSLAEDECLTALLRAGGLRHPSLVAGSLLWNATLARAAGVRTADGHDVYREEWERMRPDLFVAEEQVKSVISPELYEALVAAQWDETATDALRASLIASVRRVLSTLMARAPQAKVLMRSLLDAVEANAEDLPEYAQSRTAAAHHFQRYENHADDTCFFFG